MSGIYIALGANLSNKKTSFIKALEALGRESVSILGVSGLWQSPSWPPGQGYPDYLNAVAEIDTSHSPQALLTLLQKIETELGRERTVRNAPRPLDLDILDFKGRVLDTDRLTLPHPRMTQRGFVLFPLAQVAPGWSHPARQICGANRVDHFIARLPLKDVSPMKYRGRFWTGSR